MTISKLKYNADGERLAVDDSSDVKEYSIHTVINGELKTIEKFYDGWSWNKYFISPSESISELVQKIIIEKGEDWTFYYDKKQAGRFTQWACDEFRPSGELGFRSIIVLDEYHNKICSHTEYCWPGGFSGVSEKHFYAGLSNKWEDCWFTFQYNEGGILDRVIDNHNNFDNVKPLDLTQFLGNSRIQKVFPWEDHPYYHSLFPLLPSGKL